MPAASRGHVHSLSSPILPVSPNPFNDLSPASHTFLEKNTAHVYRHRAFHHYRDPHVSDTENDTSDTDGAASDSDAALSGIENALQPVESDDEESAVDKVLITAATRPKSSPYRYRAAVATDDSSSKAKAMTSMTKLSAKNSLAILLEKGSSPSRNRTRAYKSSKPARPTRRMPGLRIASNSSIVLGTGDLSIEGDKQDQEDELDVSYSLTASADYNEFNDNNNVHKSHKGKAPMPPSSPTLASPHASPRRAVRSSTRSASTSPGIPSDDSDSDQLPSWLSAHWHNQREQSIVLETVPVASGSGSRLDAPAPVAEVDFGNGPSSSRSSTEAEAEADAAELTVAPLSPRSTADELSVDMEMEVDEDLLYESSTKLKRVRSVPRRAAPPSSAAAVTSVARSRYRQWCPAQAKQRKQKVHQVERPVSRETSHLRRTSPTSLLPSRLRLRRGRPHAVLSLSLPDKLHQGHHAPRLIDSGSVSRFRTSVRPNASRAAVPGAQWVKESYEHRILGIVRRGLLKRSRTKSHDQFYLDYANGFTYYPPVLPRRTLAFFSSEDSDDDAVEDLIHNDDVEMPVAESAADRRKYKLDFVRSKKPMKRGFSALRLRFDGKSDGSDERYARRIALRRLETVERAEMVQEHFAKLAAGREAIAACKWVNAQDLAARLRRETYSFPTPEEMAYRHEVARQAFESELAALDQQALEARQQAAVRAYVEEFNYRLAAERRGTVAPAPVEAIVVVDTHAERMRRDELALMADSERHRLNIRRQRTLTRRVRDTTPVPVADSGSRAREESFADGARPAQRARYESPQHPDDQAMPVLSASSEVDTDAAVAAMVEVVEEVVEEVEVTEMAEVTEVAEVLIHPPNRGLSPPVSPRRSPSPLLPMSPPPAYVYPPAHLRPRRVRRARAPVLPSYRREEHLYTREDPVPPPPFNADPSTTAQVIAPVFDAIVPPREEAPPLIHPMFDLSDIGVPQAARRAAGLSSNRASSSSRLLPNFRETPRMAGAWPEERTFDRSNSYHAPREEQDLADLPTPMRRWANGMNAAPAEEQEREEQPQRLGMLATLSSYVPRFTYRWRRE